MLRKGIIVRIRNEEERQCFIQAADKLGLRGNAGSTPERITSSHMPISILIANCSSNNCMSYASNATYRDGINEVVEAADLFRNQLISMRRAKNG